MTKLASVHEYEPAAFTAITVFVTQSRAVLYHETLTPEEESRLSAGLIMSFTNLQYTQLMDGYTGLMGLP